MRIRELGKYVGDYQTIKDININRDPSFVESNEEEDCQDIIREYPDNFSTTQVLRNFSVRKLKPGKTASKNL